MNCSQHYHVLVVGISANLNLQPISGFITTGSGVTDNITRFGFRLT